MSASLEKCSEGRARSTAGEGTRRLVESIDALLPQTQCTRCGYPSCRDYARAVAAGETGVNRCGPGGETTVASLAALLGVRVEPLDPTCGGERPWTVAHIDESACIGCTLCIRACPVDAIVGAARRMHTVITSECTGCELCVSPCPVDCIALRPMPVPEPGREEASGDEPSGHEFLERWMRHRAPLARRRYERRCERLAQGNAAQREARRRRAQTQRRADLAAKRAEIAAAVARVRARRAGAGEERR